MTFDFSLYTVLLWVALVTYFKGGLNKLSKLKPLGGNKT